MRIANQALDLKTSHINQFFCQDSLCPLIESSVIRQVLVVWQVFQKVFYCNIYILIQPLIDSLFEGTTYESSLIYQDLLLAVDEINYYV